MPSTHKKDKPWDTEDIDKWAEAPFTAESNAGGPFLESSTFATLFPKYREVYLKAAWPAITKALAKRGIDCTLDLVEGSMKVSTTRKTYDPAAILNARDLIKLLARSVPADQAIKVLEDGTYCDIIKIRGMVRNKDRFAKRRQRLLGPNMSTLKALELLTETYILVQGHTVSVMGSHRGLKEVRRVVEDCMANIHPVYHIKELMIKRELAKDPQLKNESWDRFLPHFKKRSMAKRRVPHVVTKKKTYTPFPPEREKSKLDLQMESGEYFLSKFEKERVEKERKEESTKEKIKEKKRKRQEAFVDPDEEPEKKTKKKKKKKKETVDEEDT
ncbi:hypothetical protein K470DRAFT_208525 [Piedraia hortae CBS 480.64]|uniref:KRR1 small subunit processome component n=1 Tax=Piedraia hortae CBS 480.64 TaxID=1314780 RepID=A0A6A7CA96_9PEZI|nr:hypothetical protein K470DRAFT_208525 [Piedraia hortae CBS 480.64]